MCNFYVQKFLDSDILIFISLFTFFQLEPGATMDASQEIVALGVCQFVGSFIGSMPVTASFGRSAIQAASGVKSPFAGCVTALIILCACAFLTPHFAYIPTSALSAVIICAMIFTIEVEILLPIWKSKSKSRFIIVYYMYFRTMKTFCSLGTFPKFFTEDYFCVLHEFYECASSNLLLPKMIYHKNCICNLYGLHVLCGCVSSNVLLQKSICDKIHILNLCSLHELCGCVSSKCLLEKMICCKIDI